MDSNEDLTDHWSAAAPFWEKHREVIRAMFAPVTRALVADAKIGLGETVLDVATGPGEPALSIADIVGPAGAIVGIDLIPGMVEAARREAQRRALSNARFETAFADQLPFAAHTFDAVVSRFGVMFFPSPVDGIREILRVLKPGGRVAMAVWHVANRNPFFYLLSDILKNYIDVPPNGPDDPDPFRFAQPGKLLNVLSQAGASDGSERLLQFLIEPPVSPDEFWTLRSEMSDTFRSNVASLSPQQIAEIRSQFLEAIRPYSSKNRLSFPAEVVVVNCTALQ
jgi:ubiquinone/menaquinone biosynthesis C-methylase UbiE